MNRDLPIEINLARTPFISYTLFHLAAGILGLAGVVVLALNVWSAHSLFGRRTEAERELEELRLQVQKEEREMQLLAPFVSSDRLEATAEEAEQVKSFIDRRVFDWDLLFVTLESLVPNNVRLLALEPKLVGSKFVIQVQGVAKGLNDQNDFVAKLEGSELFEKVFVSNQSAEGGEIEFTLEAAYLGAGRPQTGGR